MFNQGWGLNPEFRNPLHLGVASHLPCSDELDTGATQGALKAKAERKSDDGEDFSSSQMLLMCV